MRKIVITGSEGLIGIELQRQIKNLNIDLLLLDKKFPKHHPNYGDITDSSLLADRLKDCDGIIHLAAVSRVIWGEENPDLCWETNVLATKNILHLAHTSPKNPWVLYASSREVYGDQTTLPVKENANRIAVNHYGRSKIAAEEWVESYQNKGLNSTIMRFSNVFGSIKDHATRVVPAFCQAAASGEDIFVEGANNLFDFTYVEDVVRGVVKIIELLIKRKAVPTVHFTTGIPTSLLELAQKANALGGNKATIKFREARSFDVARFYGDNSCAKNFLQWQPLVSLEEGLTRLINAYRETQTTKSDLLLERCT